MRAPFELKLQLTVAFLGLALCLTLELLFAFLFGYSYFQSRAHHNPELLWSALSGIVGLSFCSQSAFYFWRRRAFLRSFGRWHDPEQNGENVEQRGLLRGAGDAFEAMDFEKSARMLQRYLEQRPADNTQRGNLVSSLVLQGKVEEALPLLKVAGDPYQRLRWLEQAGGWRSRFWWSRPFDAAGSWRALSWSRLLVLLCLVLFSSAAIVGHEEDAFKSIYHSVNHILDPNDSELRDEFYSLISDTFDESRFKRSEDENFIFFYHQDAVLPVVKNLADAALQYNLKFYGLSDHHFSNGKIKFYVCDNRAEYMKRPGAMPWEGGVAIPAKSMFFTYVPEDGRLVGYYEITVAHELSHICYEQIIPGIHQDSWLNEGLAQTIGFRFFLEKYQVPAQAILQEKVFKDVAAHPLPFELFLHHRPQELTTTAAVSQFYMQGTTMAYVLLQYYGKESFIHFLHSFSRSNDMNLALSEAYPTIHELNDLQGVWSLFMKQ